jgi:Tol biopolymer transport system component
MRLRSAASDHLPMPAVGRSGPIAFGLTAAAIVAAVVACASSASARKVVPASGFSLAPALSADGRYVAFTSYAANLVAGDRNRAADVFVLDRVTGKIELVSVSTGGRQGDDNSGSSSSTPLAISADGRVVAFESDASTLVAGDTNGQGRGGESCPDVFVRDRVARTTVRVNVSSSGKQAVNQGYEACSGGPSLSADGRFVAFWSDASNLVPGDTNACEGERWCGDVFVHDRRSGTTERASVIGAGRQTNNPSSYVRPALSAGGRLVFFSSLLPGAQRPALFVRDRPSAKTSRVSTDGSGPAVTPDGRFVAFVSSGDVLVRDRLSGATEHGAVSSAGRRANGASSAPAISADGRFVAFVSWATNLVVHDTNTCTEFDPAGGVRSRYPCPDVFVHDRATGKTQRMSVSSTGTQANTGGGDYGPISISADGRLIAFSSSASNLVAGDTNRMPDVFVHDRTTGTTSLLSVGR